MPTSLRAIAALVLVLTSASAQTMFAEVPASADPPDGLPTIPLFTRSICSADVDFDGDEDILVTTNTTLLFRNSPAGYSMETLIGGPGPVPALHLADIDGDGFVDLLAGQFPNFFFPELRIWWGDGNTFPGPTMTTVQLQSNAGQTGVELGDFDNDNDLDIVFTASIFPGTNGNLALRNLGNRSFAPLSAAEFPMQQTGESQAFFEDLDGDGWRDLVLVSATEQTRLYWNNGGTFAAADAQSFPVITASLRGLAAADFDGDGSTDLALGGGNDPGLLLRSVGPRQFAAAPGIELPRRVVRLLAEDQDGDGDVDLTVFAENINLELRNSGSGMFVTSRASGSADAIAFVHPVDLDGDGDDDWLRIGLPPSTSSETTARVSAAFTVQPGQLDYVGKTALPSELVPTLSPRAFGNLDGNAFPDVVARTSPAIAGPVTMQACVNTDGAFAYEFTPRDPALSFGFLADVDGDQLEEWITLGPNTGVLANDSGRLGSTLQPLPVPFATRRGAAADVDGDGDTDLVFASQGAASSELAVLTQQQGSWTDATATSLAVTQAQGSNAQVRIADFDGDGDVDIWFHTNDADVLYRNDGFGVFAIDPSAIPPLASPFSRCSIGDIDRDGDLDLSFGRVLLLNDGSGTFIDASARIPNVLEAGSIGFMLDVDDNGLLDLVGPPYVLFQYQLGVFTPGTNVFPFAFGSGIGTSGLIDMDLDGDLDMVTAGGSGSSSFRYLRNGHRQLSLVQPGQIGGAVKVRYERYVNVLAPQLGVFVFGSLAKTEPVLLEPYGWLQIDPLQAALCYFELLDPVTSSFEFEESVPNNPTLLGAQFCVQTLDVRGSRMRLSNLVETYLGR